MLGLVGYMLVEAPCDASQTVDWQGDLELLHLYRLVVMHLLMRYLIDLKIAWGKFVKSDRVFLSGVLVPIAFSWWLL